MADAEARVTRLVAERDHAKSKADFAKQACAKQCDARAAAAADAAAMAAQAALDAAIADASARERAAADARDEVGGGWGGAGPEGERDPRRDPSTATTRTMVTRPPSSLRCRDDAIHILACCRSRLG